MSVVTTVEVVNQTVAAVEGFTVTAIESQIQTVTTTQEFTLTIASTGFTVTEGGVTDHGALTGLADDDHTQYHNDARGDARYYTQAQADALLDDKQPLSSVLTNTTASFTTADETKLDGIAAGAEVNVNADWNAGSGGAQILNKPVTFPPSSHTHVTADVTGLQTALDGKEGAITAGTTAQYWRGDKSWQTLNKSAVGLGNVDNTTDANKPISTATETALNLKYDASNPSGFTNNTGTVTTASVVTANGFSGSVANASTTPAITIALQDANVSQSGKLTATDWNTFNGKQAALVSGTNIKTVNGTTLLGSGDLVIASGGVTAGTSTVSFGITETNESHLVVTGQTGILAGSKVIASIGTTATADYTANDHKYLGAIGVTVTTGAVVAGTGFTIYVRSYQKLTGDISINWVY
jgi:hypothetical protein